VLNVEMAREVVKRLVMTETLILVMGAAPRAWLRKDGSVRGLIVRSLVDVMRVISQSKAPVPKLAEPASTQTHPQWPAKHASPAVPPALVPT
jgi:hypothetical protein